VYDEYQAKCSEIIGFLTISFCQQNSVGLASTKVENMEITFIR
jgi:hypothetical protein